MANGELDLLQKMKKNEEAKIKQLQKKGEALIGFKDMWEANNHSRKEAKKETDLRYAKKTLELIEAEIGRIKERE